MARANAIATVPSAVATSSRCGPAKLPVPVTTRDAALLGQPGESAAELRDDRVLARPQLREIDLRRAEFDAGFGEVARGGQHLGDVQQRLRRDAADVEADAAERRVALDEHDAATEIGGAKGSGVAARPGAEHDDVGAQVRHQSRMRRRSASSAARRPVKRAPSAPSITR